MRDISKRHRNALLLPQNSTPQHNRSIETQRSNQLQIPTLILAGTPIAATVMETLTLIRSIPDLLLFFTFFLSMYLTAQLIVFRHWSSNHRAVASSCFISLSHGTPAVFLSAYALLTDPGRGFGSPNTTLQSRVLDYSIAYFLMDLFHYLIFNPSDVLFIGHHLATLFVFVTCRYVVYHGAYAILVLLILAEVTSLCQNVWTLSVDLKQESAKAARVYEILSPPFYAFYSIVRGFAGPWFVYEMGMFYAAGVNEHSIPKWIWVSWIVVVVSALCVSILWIVNLWIELFRERSGKFLKKVE